MCQSITEYFPGGLRYSQSKGCFPLSTDTMVLADFVHPRPGSQIVDLGSGSGSLGLLLCGKQPACTVTGIELHLPSHQAATENIAQNHLEQRMCSIHGDLRQIRLILPAGSCNCVVSNPPYFSSGAPSLSHPKARQELCCSLEDIFAAAKWLLPTGGDLYLVHKPERLSDLLFLARLHGLEAKALQFVSHDPAANTSLVLLHCRRGGKPGLKVLSPVILYDRNGVPTADYQRIYHLDKGV